MTLRLALPLLIAPLLMGCAMQPDYRAASSVPPTVSSVDLQSYLGLWHEIARYPNSFESECGAATAEYATRPDGLISVTNTCDVAAKPGETKQSVGKARIVEGSGGAKLKVRFAPDWIPFAEGDYWILHLEPGYSGALVGDPKGKYLWVLARAASPDQKMIDRILARAEELGSRTDPLEYPGRKAL